MADEWVGIVNTVAPTFLKGAADLTVRNRIFPALLNSRGRIKYGYDGRSNTWDIEFDEPPVTTFGDGSTLDYQRRDNYRQLTNDWRGYRATDMMTEKQKLMCRGTQGIVDLWKTIPPKLVKTITHKFAGELYIDGEAAGNSDRIHGLLTFMGQGACAATDKVAKNATASYAGRSCVQGAYGGTWSANDAVPPNATLANDWPGGQGDVKYDHMCAKLINTSATTWGTGSTAWEDNCIRILRQTTNWCTHGGGKDAKPTIHLLAQDMMTGYQNAAQAMTRLWIPVKEAVELGFPDTLNQEGVIVKEDYEVYAGQFFTVNCDQMELDCLYDELFKSQGPDFDPRTLNWLFSVGFFGNARYSPKFFGHGKARA